MKAKRRPPVAEPTVMPDLGDAFEFMRVIWAVAHGLQKASKRLAASAGVTGPQRLVLHVVGRFPGISVGQLAATLHVHASTLTGVLGRLRRRGLLDRRRDPRDRRRAALGLTPVGRSLDLTVTGTVEAAVIQVLDDLPPHQARAAREALTRLARQLGVDGAGRPRRA